MPHIEYDLIKLLDSFSEAIEFWLLSLGNDEETSSSTSSANVKNPLEELSKLSKLIKAHTTKVGIIFKPSTIEKGEASAAYNTFQKLSESSILLNSVMQQLDQKIISKIFYDELVDCVRLMFGSMKVLVGELREIAELQVESEDNQKKDDELDAGSKRLVSIGMIWNNCDTLDEILKKGKLGILTAKLKRSIEFIDDGLDEFEEWASDPQEMDDDPFGLGDYDSDEEEEEAAPSKNEDRDLDSLIKFSQNWLGKFKLVKLLLISITKSLPEVTSGETIDSIYATQKSVVSNIDKLIGSLTINMEWDDEDCKEFTENINKGCRLLVKQVREVNKKSESKVKWCDAWQSKFSENA